MQYAIWVILSANAATLLSQIDMQMILAILGPEDAGYYTNYLSIIRIPFMFLLPGVIFLFPVFSDLFQQKKIQSIIQIRERAYNYFSTLGIITGLFFLCFGNMTAIALFGEQYALSGTILMYSCMFLVFNFLLQIDFQIFSATGRPRQKMIILCIGIALNFITNLIFIRMLGVAGAALATGLGWVLLWMISWYKVGVDFQCSFDAKFFLKNTLIFLLLSLIIKYILIDISIFGRMQLFLLVCLVGGIYGLTFIALNYQHIQQNLLTSIHKKKA